MVDDLTPEEQPPSQGASGASSAGGPAGPAAGYADPAYTESGVPTLEGVREKIERRYGTALGATELARDTPEGRAVDERYDAIKEAAADKLKQIRDAMDTDG